MSAKVFRLLGGLRGSLHVRSIGEHWGKCRLLFCQKKLLEAAASSSSCSSSASATGAFPPTSTLYREVVVFEVMLTRGEFPGGSLIESWNAGCACHLPVLQGLAEMLCTCCASSVSSESCFSMAGAIATPRRDSLSSSLFEKLVFLRDKL